MHFRFSFLFCLECLLPTALYNTTGIASMLLISSNEDGFLPSILWHSLQLLEVFQIYAFIKYLNMCFQGGNIFSAQSCTSRFILSAGGEMNS